LGRPIFRGYVSFREGKVFFFTLFIFFETKDLPLFGSSLHPSLPFSGGPKVCGSCRGVRR